MCLWFSANVCAQCGIEIGGWLMNFNWNFIHNCWGILRNPRFHPSQHQSAYHRRTVCELWFSIFFVYWSNFRNAMEFSSLLVSISTFPFHPRQNANNSQRKKYKFLAQIKLEGWLRVLNDVNSSMLTASRRWKCFHHYNHTSRVSLFPASKIYEKIAWKRDFWIQAQHSKRSR